MTGTQRKSTALVVDDHPITHLGCRSLLSEQGFTTILKALDGPSMLKVVAESPPDLILLDLGLPGTGGLQLLPQLCNKLSDTGCTAPIIIFSMQENPSCAAIAFDLGAQGYLSKNASQEEFRTAIREVMSGNIYLEPTITIRTPLLPTEDSPPPEYSLLSQLTPRERQIMSMITSGHSYTQISNLTNISDKTVSKISSKLQQKLSARNLTDLIRLGITMGLTKYKQP